ncbi:DUF1844 domain-containing protein [bacterium]|nr:DUF1844 domain-containing protein [bacterium]
MPDNNNEEKKPKFKIVDRRRIDVDKIEPASTPVEGEPSSTPEDGKAPDLKAVGGDEKEPEILDEEQSEPDFKVAEDTEPPPEPSEETESAGQDPLEYLNIALSFLQTLVSVSWVHLGLVPHPQTKLVTKKLEDAKNSIEMFELIYGNVRDDLPPQLVVELERTLQDMKANYVNQLS